ncbi:hypothetical protein MTR67_000915 [Solanum verrucosum]|uniref:F-box domain-containing protein n=1 Tax=Solanum verrucosum TaxID=315347 RepID=A0AAF0PQV0_SOLVR|nr:hypothetical protein MTR67_000915 [Solanum verrucosum]
MEKMKMKFSIPDEIMFEIFSWLPVKSLMRFKCVSGLCNSLIFESDCIWEPYSVRPALIFNPITRELVLFYCICTAYTYENSVANFTINYNNQGYRKSWASGLA